MKSFNNPTKHLFFLFSVFLFLFFIGCKSDVDANHPITTDDSKTPSTETESNTTYLKVICNFNLERVASTSMPYYISRVGLVGYSFDDLRINYQESKTFELHDIPGGLNNVNVNVTFKPIDSKYIDMTYSEPASIKCNFTHGKTTTITLTNEGTLTVSY